MSIVAAIHVNLPARSAVKPSIAAALIAFAVCIGLLAAPGSARGHAAVADTSPQSDSRVEVSPASIRIEFNESLSSELSTARILNLESGSLVQSRLSIQPRSMQLIPVERLSRGRYRVDWRAVSTLDGHPVEGSFGFGVRTSPPEVSESVEQNPLRQNGILRIAARSVFYAAVLVLVGGLLTAAIWLPRHREPDEAVVPPPSGLNGRATIVAGCVAIAVAVVVLALDTVNAGGDLDSSTLLAYVLDTDSGRSRLVAIALIAVATAAAWRGWQRTAIVAALMVPAAIAFSGHANSADPRVVSLVTDWLHLVAASVWIGGMALMAITVRSARRDSSEFDQPALLKVIDRFGDLALPAFLATVVTGLYNTAIEIGNVQALWTTNYGRILTTKIVLVAAIVAVSGFHSRYLRPSLDSKPGDRKRVSAYWRVIANEPLLAIGVAVLAATLAVFPLPPRQAGASTSGTAPASCGNCVRPRQGEASFADQAGSTLVAVTMQRSSGGLVGRILTLDRAGRPIDTSISLSDGRTTGRCGPGCQRFAASTDLAILDGSLVEGQATRRFSVPADWTDSSRAEALSAVRTAQSRMRALSTLRADERISVAPSVGTRTAFESQSPDRLRFTGSNGAGGVIIGRKRWTRATPSSPWAGPMIDSERFDTDQSFIWMQSAEYAWILSKERRPGTLRLAFMDPAEPVWYELRVDRRSGLVTNEKMTSPGHFMTTRYFDFNSALTVRPPK